MQERGELYETGMLYLKRSTCSTRIVYREHIVLRTMYVQTETIPLSERKSNMPSAFVTGKRQPGFINPIFFLLGSAALCPTGSLSCARNAVQCDVENRKSQTHIMPSVSLKSKPTDFFRMLKRFLFSFSLSIV